MFIYVVGSGGLASGDITAPPTRLTGGGGAKFCIGIPPALRRLLCVRLPALEDEIEEEEVEEEDALLFLLLDAGRG